MSVLFEGEDGVGDGVSREAAQVMMNAVLDGPEGRPEEALFVPWPPPEDGAYSDPDGGQPSVSEAHGGGGANASKPSVWDFNEADEIPDPFDPDFDQMMAAAAAAPTPALLRTINPDVPAAHMKTVFRFVGRLIGMTIASSKTVTLPLAPWIWAAMLGRRGTMQQLESVDEEEISRTMMRLHTHPLEDELNAWAAVHPPSFSRTVAIPTSISRARARAADTARNASTCAPPSSSSDAGEATSRALDETPNTVPETSTAAAAAAAAVTHVTVDLIPSGRDVPVTNDNRKRYVELYARHRMETVRGKSILGALRALRAGLTEVTPKPPETLNCPNPQLPRSPNLQVPISPDSRTSNPRNPGTPRP
jgi:hypothetical protein